MWRHSCVLIGVVGSLLCILPGDLAAQSDSTTARRAPPHAEALARIGRSGLRALLSASGGIGDLQNRAGSYRNAVQMERARVGPLQGRLVGLDERLADPDLSVEERAAVLQLRASTLAELEAIPRYEAAYSTATLQLEAMLPFGMLGARPVFLLVRGRGHGRGAGTDRLTVFSEQLDVTAVLVASPRWVLGIGTGLGTTEVDIGAFDGSSNATSRGFQLYAGRIIADGWSVAAQAGHAWTNGRSTIVRPSGAGPVEVRSEGDSKAITAKLGVRGRFALVESRGTSLVARPSAVALLMTTHARPTTNSLGETGSGPFGERETLAALRGGVALEAGTGAWTPSVYLGWERELTDEMSVRVRDPSAVLGSAGLTWTWGRGRRAILEYGYLHGLEGLRRVSDLTLIVLIDG